MSCVYVFKGNEYSESEFYDLIDKNKQEFFKSQTLRNNISGLRITEILSDLSKNVFAKNHESFSLLSKEQSSYPNLKSKLSANINIAKLFESNSELANEVYSIMGLNTINESEITYTDEEGNPCAKMGLTNTVKGTGWKIVKDFKGKPKHSNGGVDITISDKGVTMRRGGKDIKAKYGLLIINNN